MGYGIFWALVEDLYQNANALPTHYDSIAYDLHTIPEIVKSVINDFGLFVVDGDSFGSLSVQRRLDVRNKKSIKARESANKRWKEKEPNANALRTQSDSNAIKERKGKNIKEKDNIYLEKSGEALEEFFKEMVMDGEWRDLVKKQYSLSDYHFSVAIGSFKAICMVSNEKYSLSNLKRYFSHWYHKNKESIVKNSNPTNGVAAIHKTIQ